MRSARIVAPRRSLSRRIPQQFRAEIRKYAEHTGLALWAWNSLHANLFILFWFITARGSDFYHKTAHGIWHEIQSDSTQRSMLLNVARAELDKSQHLLTRIEWLIRVVDKIARYRNIITHTPAIFSPHFRLRPAADPAATRNVAKERFNQISHAEFWRALIGDLNALTLYAQAIAWEIPEWTRRGTLPRRPRLLSLARIEEIEAQITRISQLEARSLLQSPSRGKRKPGLASAYVVKRGRSTNRRKAPPVC